jgi:DNA-directed RNA polymerase specialized sigma24 family protein
MFGSRSESMQGGLATAGRKRAAAELVAREDAELRRTARRYSLCEDDAEDAYQRALEILLVKATGRTS